MRRAVQQATHGWRQSRGRRSLARAARPHAHASLAGCHPPAPHPALQVVLVRVWRSQLGVRLTAVLLLTMLQVCAAAAAPRPGPCRVAMPRMPAASSGRAVLAALARLALLAGSQPIRTRALPPGQVGLLLAQDIAPPSVASSADCGRAHGRSSGGDAGGSGGDCDGASFDDEHIARISLHGLQLAMLLAQLVCEVRRAVALARSPTASLHGKQGWGWRGGGESAANQQQRARRRRPAPYSPLPAPGGGAAAPAADG